MIASLSVLLPTAIVSAQLLSFNGGQAPAASSEMTFVTIPDGSFVMGSNTGDKNERPPHPVVISRTFDLQNTEVTQAQWEAVMGSNPSQFRGPDMPLESVSWTMVHEFIGKLNDRNDGYVYRLPTEAEWEYAARAGTLPDVAGNVDELCWYDKNSGLRPQPVRSKRPNAWGLYEMRGNVWEWVQDWFGKYARKRVIDPKGPASGRLRVVRGGGWHSTADACRVTFRLGAEPEFRNSALGLRLARVSR